ncbi:hypothetical protein ACFFTN_02470 [Aminobacter aganoensis]|uniref:Uncharacterized protein n=1 Tax=Aminobacter aganoensis TaxID=83264 RepID=A0A7X0F659_9HYPH|nr:hypothetical protein [Aminobacter aganoensis]MBB6353846.1 hypothetical protein [Aminobacter aganoensis]
MRVIGPARAIGPSDATEVFIDRQAAAAVGTEIDVMDSEGKALQINVEKAGRDTGDTHDWVEFFPNVKYPLAILVPT